MKKLSLSLILVLSYIFASGQTTWVVTPTDFTLECNDATNNQSIIDYIATISATNAGCADAPLVTTDYSDPGNFTGGDIIMIEFIAEDACDIDPDLITSIEVTIDDTVAPVETNIPQNETVECGPNNAAELAAWINNHANGTYEDDCTASVDLVLNTSPDPVTLMDLTMGCGLNDGQVEVDFLG